MQQKIIAPVISLKYNLNVLFNFCYFITLLHQVKAISRFIAVIEFQCQFLEGFAYNNPLQSLEPNGTHSRTQM